MEAIILIGAPAAGKSTFFATRFADTHVRINLDMLKTRSREERFVMTCVETRQSFVVDNTNPTAEDRARYIEPTRTAGYAIKGFYFESKIEDLLRRNADRSGRRRIPDKGVRASHARIELPRRAEGFDQLYFVRIGEDGDFMVEEWIDEV